MRLPEKNWLEWAVFAISFVMVASVLGYLAYDAITLGDTPPTVAVTLGSPEQRGEHFVVPVSVTNHGDQTAEDVMVEVALVAGGDEQTSEFDIAFLPRGATREGWAAFRDDPSTGALAARVLGYTQP
jgi:uncharacterized protein (TIGR02588 family)